MPADSNRLRRRHHRRGLGEQSRREIEHEARHAVTEREVAAPPAARPPPTCEMRGDLRPRGVRPRGRRLREVAEHGDRPARSATSDHAQLHRREVLRLVDDHVSVSRRVPLEQVARLVDQREIGRRSMVRCAARRIASCSAGSRIPSAHEASCSAFDSRSRTSAEGDTAGHTASSAPRSTGSAWIDRVTSRGPIRGVPCGGTTKFTSRVRAARHVRTCTARRAPPARRRARSPRSASTAARSQPDPHDESLGERCVVAGRPHSRSRSPCGRHPSRAGPRPDSTARTFTSGTRSASVTCKTASSPSDGSTCAM